MSENSRKGMVILIGVVLPVLLSAWFAHWWLSHRPKKGEKPAVVVGVGLYLGRNQKTHKFEVKRVFPNSPADKAGLVPGLILNKVGEHLAETNNIKGLSALLIVPLGSTVTLEMIDTNNFTNEVELVRQRFANQSAQ